MNEEELNNLKCTLCHEQKINYSLIENIKRLNQENKQLKDNWNELKKLFNQKYYNGERIDIKDILDKMQELEQDNLIEK